MERFSRSVQSISSVHSSSSVHTSGSINSIHLQLGKRCLSHSYLFIRRFSAAVVEFSRRELAVTTYVVIKFPDGGQDEAEVGSGGFQRP